MKQRITIFTVTGLMLGVVGLIFTPFTDINSPLYSETFDRISTELVFTPEAAYASCGGSRCLGPNHCGSTSARTDCDIDDDGCVEYMCSVE